jgi:hypothetical protein
MQDVRETVMSPTCQRSTDGKTVPIEYFLAFHSNAGHDNVYFSAVNAAFGYTEWIYKQMLPLLN